VKYSHIVAEVFGKPWAIHPDKLRVITELVALRASGEILSEEQVRERIAGANAAKRSGPNASGNVAVLPLYGVISHRMNMFQQFSGGTSTEQFTAAFRQALNDPNVKAIVIDVDSPGGSVAGVAELASEIFEARGQKRIIAVANTMAASAAYYIASAADELVVTPSGEVGSIGVFAAHQDVSKALEAEGVKVTLVSAGKYKTEGNPYEPLSEEAQASIQALVDDFYSQFVKAVAKHRDVTTSAVRGGFGEGRMVLAADAVKEGMADKVATLDQTLARFGATGPAQKISAEAPRSLRERELELYR
jgi:signal peptide peptidase SppA